MPNHAGTWTFPKVRRSPGRGVIVALFMTLLNTATARAADADHVRVRLGSSNTLLEFTAEAVAIPALKFDVQKKRGEVLRVRIEKTVAGLARLSVLSRGRQVLEHVIADPPLRLVATDARMGTKNLPPELLTDAPAGVLELRAEVEFADYLIGVLSREMPGIWPMEALKAQAIATRSYTLSQIRARSEWSFDLEGSVLDQEFEWVTPARRRSPALRRWAEALTATRDQVLRRADGEVFRAYYHADCGGRTTTPDFVWGPSGDYKSVRDPACETRASNKWKFVAEKNWLRRQLRDPAGESARAPAVQAGFEFSWIQSLFDQRVTLVEWWDGISSLKILSGQNFRQLLGFGKLKSLRFRTREEGRRVVFEGQGYGHGVGLCQWGSKDWAEQGLRADQILRHYYPLAIMGASAPKRVASATGR